MPMRSLVKPYSATHSISVSKTTVFRNEPSSGKYTVRADCTGTTIFESDGTQYDLFIAPDGSMFTFVETKSPERVAAGFELRGTAKRVGH